MVRQILKLRTPPCEVAYSDGIIRHLKFRGRVQDHLGHLGDGCRKKPGRSFIYRKLNEVPEVVEASGGTLTDIARSMCLESLAREAPDPRGQGTEPEIMGLRAQTSVIIMHAVVLTDKEHIELFTMRAQPL